MYYFKKAVLVIHGFSGGTFENECLVNDLKLNTNFEVFDFTLPGHDRDVIKDVKYEDWIKACDLMMEKILKKYRTIYLVGHSMGGILATHLATKHEKRVKKLVLLAPGFQYINMEQIKNDIRSAFKRDKNKELDNQEKGIYDDAFVKVIRVPITTAIEFTKLAKELKKEVAKVKCKTLIMHGMLDPIVPLSSSEYVYETIGSKDKYYTKIDGIRHQMLMSKKKEKISAYVRRFLRGGLEWELEKKSII